MKKDLNIEETDRVWNGREWMTRSEWRAWCEKMRPSREELARLNMKLQRLSNNQEAMAQMRTAMIVDVHRRQWAGNQELQEEMRRLHMTLRMMRFGRKAPTAAELRAQWLEQQRHEAEIRRLHETITAREATGVSPLPTDADRQQWHDRYFSNATASGC